MVRLATPADIPAMLALENVARTAAHWSQAQYERIFAEKPAGRRRHDPGVARLGLVIEDHLGVQGFLIARQVESEFEIENVVVAGSARRRGFGTHLVREVLVLAHRQGAQAVFLEVRESNQAARALYEKCGFVKIGHRKRYYQNPEEAAILYRLDLT
jgi:ribosomal-protein-alanine N-acetyltransferase